MKGLVEVGAFCGISFVGFFVSGFFCEMLAIPQWVRVLITLGVAFMLWGFWLLREYPEDAPEETRIEEPRRRRKRRQNHKIETVR